MKLPGGDRAVVPIEKLRDYALNPEHGADGAKAVGFWRALRMGRAHARDLQRLIQSAAKTADAVPFGRTAYGELYTADVTIAWNGRLAAVRTGWIIRWDEDFPRLVTAFVTAPRGGPR